jgi:hypothetical protein
LQFIRKFQKYSVSKELSGRVDKALDSKLYDQEVAVRIRSKGLDLENLLSRFPDLTIHQEVPKLFTQQELRGRVDKALDDKLYDQEEAVRIHSKGLDLENLLSRFPDLTIHQEVPKLFSQQELRGRVDKTTAQQSEVQQFESTGFQDGQTAAEETSGSNY